MGQPTTFLGVVALCLMLNALTNGQRSPEITKNSYTPQSPASQPAFDQPGAFGAPNIPLGSQTPGLGPQLPPFRPPGIQNPRFGPQSSPFSQPGFQDPNFSPRTSPSNPPGFQGPGFSGPGSPMRNSFSPPSSQNFAPSPFRPQTPDFRKPPPPLPPDFFDKLFPPNFNKPVPSPPNSFGPQNSGPNSFGPQNSGPNSFGPQNSGPNSFSPRNSGPNSFGPQNSGLNSFGPLNSGPNSFGPQNSGPNYFGPHNSGPNSFGPQNSGPNSFGPQNSGPNSFGPQNTGPNSFVPQNSGPNSFGLQNSGPNSYRPQGPSFSNPWDSSVPRDSRLQDPPHQNSNIQDSKPSSAGPQQAAPRHSGPHRTSFRPSHQQTSLKPRPQHTGPQEASFRSRPQQTGPISSGPKESAPISYVTHQADPIPTKPTVSSSTPQRPTANPKPQTTKPSNRPPSHNQHSNVKPHPSTHHPNKHQSDEDLNGLRIVCIYNIYHYYRNEDFEPQHILPQLCTHLNYEFATLDPKTFEMQSGEPALDSDMDFYQQAIDLKKKNPKLKVLLSLGGWRDSTKKYSDLAADPEKRKNFIDKAIPFITKHGFNGMDFAWEYPNCWQGAIGINPKDKDNYVTFLKEMKPEFEKKNLTLSVSVGAIKREVDAAYDVPAISDIVDYINVMTYDMHGPWESKTGHHAQFKELPGDKDPYCNTVGALNVWIDKGADKKKINMGMPMYGNSFRLKDPSQNGMGAPTVGVGDPGPDSKEAGLLLYNEICRSLDNGTWTEKRDKNAGFYAFSGDQWVCYDPPMMGVEKVKYVVENGLGGVLMKDLSGDDYRGECFSMPFPMLKMINMEMEKAVRRQERRGK